MKDFAEFEAWLLLEKGWARVTVEVTMRQIRMMERAGVDFGAFTLDEGRAFLTGRLKRGVSPWAYNTDVKALNKVAEFYLGEKRAFRKRATPRTQFRALTDAQVHAVLAYRHPHPDVERLRRAMALWALKSGMRLSEVHRMNVQDLDPEKSRFFVAHPAKRGKRRWLPVEPWVWSPKRPLGAYLARRPEPAGEPGALWVTAEKGPPRRLSQHYMRRTMWDISQAVGFPFSFTVTRHTRATELVRRGWDLLYVQQYLGHRSVTSTQVYAEVRPEDVAALMKRRPGPDYFQHRT